MTETTRIGLSRERILDAAQTLVSSEPTGFSMRKLAERLDVTPMAVYRWFDGKEALLDALTERLVSRSVTTTPASDASRPWLERGLQWAAEFRRGLLGHLPLLQMEGASRRLAVKVFDQADEGLALMVELGYEGQAAVDAYRVLFWSVLNFCLIVDATDAFPGHPAPGVLIERVTQAEGDDWATRLPTLAAHIDLFSALDADVFFEMSLRTVLGGLSAAALRP